MSKLKIKITGLDDVIGAFSRFDKETRVAVRKAVRVSANRIRKTAQSKVPIRTGGMQKRIRARYAKDGFSAEIAPRTGFASLVEFGTVHSRAQPFMQPTAEEERDRYIKQMEQALKDTVRGL